MGHRVGASRLFWRVAEKLPEFFGAEDRVRGGALPAEAGVATQGKKQVSSLTVQVVPQNHTAKPQVGLQVKQLTGVTIPKQPGPEGHDLHVATRAST